MNESGFTQGINRRVKNIDPTVRVWKIADRFTRDVPDARYSGHGGRLYIEYKWLRAFPKKAPVRPALTAGQRHWLDEEAARGVQVAVAVGAPEGVLLYPDLDWYKPIPAENALITPRDLAQWIVKVVSPKQSSTSTTPPTSSSVPRN